MEPNSAEVSNSKLNLFKFTPKQLMVTLLSMALSILVYAWIFGFWFSFLFVVMMLVHEMGHVFACRIKKVESSPPVFVPFLGAFIASPDLESDREKEAFVGYGGPFLGTLGALALFGLWIVLGKHILHSRQPQSFIR
ncbi:MAG: site-2 protease family protein, partial [Patescibacteria group bacterium]